MGMKEYIMWCLFIFVVILSMAFIAQCNMVTTGSFEIERVKYEVAK
jgi:hypothetical protein